VTQVFRLSICRATLNVALATCSFVSIFAAQSSAALSGRQIKSEIRGDGVEHWYVVEPNDACFFVQWIQQLYNVQFLKKTPPFGRSIAFLVGVGTYHNFSPQLQESVHNDLIEMRELLLNDMGFDEVYIAKDDIVNRDLIEEYIKGTIANGAGEHDRLLFYYSGHGGSPNRGKTGYLLFGGARKDQFRGPQVLAVDTLTDWSRELRFQHMLFILDSCASGLGITSKSVPDNRLLETLSGNGSRIVLTAGTAEEATYELQGRKNLKNGVFTAAFLKAFSAADLDTTALVTVTELFARVEKEMAIFRSQNHVATTPQMLRLDENDYRGTFVFFNLRVSAGPLPSEQAEALGVKVVAKKEGEAPTESNEGAGIIEVFSTQSGTVFFGGQNMGEILRGETLTFQRQTTGTHQVRLAPLGQGQTTSPVKDVKVESGRIVYVVFGAESPLDESGKIPVGALTIDATHASGGGVSIDKFELGQLKADGQITISSIIAGPHLVEIHEGDLVKSYSILIKATETEHLVFNPYRLTPPTGLIAIVH
jgi:hypothetical protein